MGKFLATILIFVAIFYAGKLYFKKVGGLGFEELPFLKGSLNITTSDFVSGGIIPSKFTCEGDNISPKFTISNLPLGTKSVAIIMEDKSVAPAFTHWLLFNIDPSHTTIDSSQTSIFGIVGINDFKSLGYKGPCPPLGERHRYYFRVYALNELLKSEAFDRSSFDYFSKGHILATGLITGVYAKSP